MAVNVMYTAARMQPVADAYRNAGGMYEQTFRFPDAVDAYIDGIRTLSGSVQPSELAGLYEGLVVVLFASGRWQEVLKYDEEAASLGIAGSEIRLRCESVREDHGWEDHDPVSLVQTTPHYESYITEAEREQLEAGD